MTATDLPRGGGDRRSGDRGADGREAGDHVHGAGGLGAGDPGAGPHDPARHFDLAFFAALMRLRARFPGLDGDGVRAAFPFLEGYLGQLPAWARDDDTDHAWRRWSRDLDQWERSTVASLPIARLRAACALDAEALAILFTAGMPVEDPRFGDLFAALQGGHPTRPTAAFLVGGVHDPDERRAARDAVARLRGLGILEHAGGDREGDGPLRPPASLWSVLRGEPMPDGDGLAHRGAALAPALDDLVLGPDEAMRARSLPSLVGSGSVRAILVRGPASGGRSTLLAAVARSIGLGRLDVDLAAADPARLRVAGSLASALGAMPVLRVEPAIGETVDLPELRGWSGPVGIVLPRHGGVRGPDLERAAVLELAMPDAAQRRRHWQAAMAGPQLVPSRDPAPDERVLDEIAARYRLAGGTIHRVATMARAAAALDGRPTIEPSDVRDAGRLLRGRSLETLAPRVATAGGWDDLVVDEDTAAELQLLEDRCRGRERLVGALPAPIGIGSAGVRALFTGPSGTGKTLAARLLAARLEMDLHAIQLSSVVDKYIGETEKRITEVFTRAAELDAMLLLDEGDALLGKRTQVASSNDRYANLQTNHLLQQLEEHDGIVVITTNAGERIDGAFLRRIDVVIEFRTPDAALRWALWRRHLPAGHEVDAVSLGEIAQRCAMTGGQIRNAAIHAWLLAMRRGGDPVAPTTADAQAAVRREYRKIGAVCPLRGEDGNA